MYLWPLFRNVLAELKHSIQEETIIRFSLWLALCKNRLAKKCRKCLTFNSFSLGYIICNWRRLNRMTLFQHVATFALNFHGATLLDPSRLQWHRNAYYMVSPRSALAAPRITASSSSFILPLNQLLKYENRKGKICFIRCTINNSFDAF